MKQKKQQKEAKKWIQNKEKVVESYEIKWQRFIHWCTLHKLNPSHANVLSAYLGRGKLNGNN